MALPFSIQRERQENTEQAGVGPDGNQSTPALRQIGQ